MPDRRREVLDTLRSSRSPMSIVEIAYRLGLHPNTVRFHLRGLVGDGRVDRVEDTRGAPGVPPTCSVPMWGWTQPGRATTGSSLAHWPACWVPVRTPAARRFEAGRAWGSRLTGADADADTGFSRDGRPSHRSAGAAPGRPRFHTRARPSRSRPHRAAALPLPRLEPEHAAVICPLHLGLMRGVLDALGAGVTVTRLDPFVEADLCLAHTGPAEPVP
jgi:helix-turn-helix protein